MENTVNFKENAMDEIDAYIILVLLFSLGFLKSRLSANPNIMHMLRKKPPLNRFL